MQHCQVSLAGPRDGRRFHQSCQQLVVNGGIGRVKRARIILSHNEFHCDIQHTTDWSEMSPLHEHLLQALISNE